MTRRQRGGGRGGGGGFGKGEKRGEGEREREKEVGRGEEVVEKEIETSAVGSVDVIERPPVQLRSSNEGREGESTHPSWRLLFVLQLCAPSFFLVFLS